MLDLLADVLMQVAGEAQDIAHHLVGDHVAEEAAHVGQDAGVGLQLGEHVMFEAGRERLHPSQSIGPCQHRGRDLSDECVGAGHGGLRLGGVGGVDPLGPRRGRLQGAEPVGIDGRMNHQLHGRVSGGLGVFAGFRQSFVRYRAIRAAPSAGNGGGPGLICECPVQRPVQPETLEVARGDRHPAVPVAERTVQRAELGESPTRRIDHRRAAGHRLARRAVAGLGDNGMARGDQIAAGPVGRRDDVQVVRLSVRHGIVADEMDSAPAHRSSRDQSMSLWPYRPM